MALLNGFQPTTRSFLVTVGLWSAVVYVVLIFCSIASCLSLVLSRDGVPVDPRDPNSARMALAINDNKILAVLCALIVLWVLFGIGNLVAGNSELAGLFGVASLLKLFFL